MLSAAGALRLPLKTSFLAWTYAIFWTFFLTLQTVWTYKQFLISKIFKHYQSRSINKKNHLELVESKTFRWLAFAHLDKPIGCSLMMKIILMMAMLIILIIIIMTMHIMVILLFHHLTLDTVLLVAIQLDLQLERLRAAWALFPGKKTLRQNILTHSHRHSPTHPVSHTHPPTNHSLTKTHLGGVTLGGETPSSSSMVTTTWIIGKLLLVQNSAEHEQSKWSTGAKQICKIWQKYLYCIFLLVILFVNIFHVWANSFLSLFKIFTNITKLGLPVAQEYFHPGLPRQFSKCLKILKILQNWSHLRFQNISILASLHLFRIICLLLTQLHLEKKTYKLLFLGVFICDQYLGQSARNQRSWNKFPSCSQQVEQSLCCHFQGLKSPNAKKQKTLHIWL